MTKHTLTLITGGAKSGKSRFALDLAAPYEKRAFIATAQATDPEMNERIRRHQQERKNGFSTIEAPIDLAGALSRLPAGTNVVVIDCMTVWLGNLMHHQNLNDVDTPVIAEFLAAIKTPPCDTVIVTNEVGTGIVPPDAMSRRFRDMAGTVNRRIAESADHVYLVACGLPVTLK